QSGRLGDRGGAEYLVVGDLHPVLPGQVHRELQQDEGVEVHGLVGGVGGDVLRGVELVADDGEHGVGEVVRREVAAGGGRCGHGVPLVSVGSWRAAGRGGTWPPGGSGGDHVGPGEGGGAPGEAAAEGGEQDALPHREGGGGSGVREGDGDGRGRGVADLVEVDHRPFGGDPELFGDRPQDADVGLVADQVAEAVDGPADAVQQRAGRLGHALHGRHEDLAALHREVLVARGRFG